MPSEQKLSRTDVVSFWLFRGIDDFYCGFLLQDDQLSRQNVFFCHQGLEKFFKAYLLGKKASHYEGVSFEEGKKIVDNIAKKDLGHNLERMFRELISYNVFDEKLLTKEYAEYGKSVTGQDLLELLEASYLECRYPVPEGVHKKYPVEKRDGSRPSGWWSPLDSSDIKDFAYEVGFTLFNKIEEEYELSEQIKSFFQMREDKKVWKRFCRVFLKHS